MTASAYATRTESWDEEVLLHDGRLIIINREVGYTLQVFSGDAGSPGFMKSWPDKFWLKFKNPDTQETIKWQGEQYFNPVLLDIIDGVPYLVVSGRPDKKTEKIYGCPELPFIYLKYEKGFFGKWVPIPAENSPKILRNMNLSPRYPDHLSRNGSARNYQSRKSVLENIGFNGQRWTSGKIPTNYDDWDNPFKESYRYERRQNDCRQPAVGPRATPKFEAARQSIYEAELKAEMVNATIESYSDNTEIITSDDYLRTRGIWTGYAYLKSSCNNIVRSIKPIREFFDKGGWRYNGYQLLLNSGDEIPLQKSLSSEFQAGLIPKVVTCGDDIIYVVSQKSKEKLLIQRLKSSGEVIDALIIVLPAVENITVGNEWADLWEILPENNDLTIVLAKYTYKSTANLGGEIIKKQTYKVILPSESKR